MSRFIKQASLLFIAIVFFSTLIACNVAKNTELNAENTSNNQVSNDSTGTSTYDIVPSVSIEDAGKDEYNSNGQDSTDYTGQDTVNDMLSLSLDDIDSFESYLEYIAHVPCYEPYYQLVFAFEKLKGGISSVNKENLLALYDELTTVFDFITIVSQRPLEYFGFYEGDTRFVFGYDLYQSTDSNWKIINPLNRGVRDDTGDEFFVTQLKNVILCENSISRFDNSVAEGRNLQVSDFILTAQDEPISVVLGAAYKGVYELGDVFSMVYIYVPMIFKVVGFYEPGLYFSMAAAAAQYVNIDESIVMPYFIPMYDPDEDSVFQHGFHIAELTSGYIAISEPIEEINDETYTNYIGIVEEIAARYGLSGMLESPLWPVGFVFGN